MIFDDVELALETLFRPGLSGAFGANCKRWRLWFLVMPTGQLRDNFEVARKPKVLLGTVAATEDNAAGRLATLDNLARSRW
jgi:hypothetical protein